eukprot:33709-Eustigmatos_ZCMA.PRE.1
MLQAHLYALVHCGTVFVSVHVLVWRPVREARKYLRQYLHVCRCIQDGHGLGGVLVGGDGEYGLDHRTT